jgi:hypothetical protein
MRFASTSRINFRSWLKVTLLCLILSVRKLRKLRFKHKICIKRLTLVGSMIGRVSLFSRSFCDWKYKFRSCRYAMSLANMVLVWLIKKLKLNIIVLSRFSRLLSEVCLCSLWAYRFQLLWYCYAFSFMLFSILWQDWICGCR